MNWDPIQMSVFSEPLPPSGSETTRSTTFLEPEMANAGAASGVTGSRSPGTSDAKPGELPMTSMEVSCLVMRGELELAIRDLQRCRSLSWITQEMRIQLGRCVYELIAARRMCP